MHVTSSLDHGLSLGTSWGFSSRLQIEALNREKSVSAIRPFPPGGRPAPDYFRYGIKSRIGSRASFVGITRSVTIKAWDKKTLEGLQENSLSGGAGCRLPFPPEGLLGSWSHGCYKAILSDTVFHFWVNLTFPPLPDSPEVITNRPHYSLTVSK